MKKSPSKILIPVIIFIVLVLAGVLIYLQQKNPQVQSPSTANKSCVTHNNKVHCAEDYLGLSEAEVNTKASRDGLEVYRILNKDVEGGTEVTDDHISHRFNFTLSGGKVIKVTFG